MHKSVESCPLELFIACEWGGICMYLLFYIYSPPVNPPKEIDDPNEKKPEDWDEKEKYVFYLFIVWVWCKQ